MKYKKYGYIVAFALICFTMFYGLVGKNLIVNYFLDKAENTNETEKYYNYALRFDSENSEIRNMLINFYLENEMYEEASDAVNQAIFADKNNEFAYRQKVKLLTERGEIATAIKIQQAIDENLTLEFITKPDEYFEETIVEISVPKNCQVYYKINASSYVLYSSAFGISDGYYDIYAVAISSDGTLSNVINGEFKIINLTAPVMFSGIDIAFEVGSQIGYFGQNDITSEQLRSIENIDLTGFDITDDDVVTLSNCSSLKTLKLGDVSQVSTFYPLLKLPNLSEISIEGGCSFELFEDVVSIKTLEYIKVLNSSIYKIPTSKCLPETLILNNCLITDIFNISTFKSVEKLDLSNNIISEIYGVQNLRNICEINFSGNKISDISYLSESISLQKINLSNNEIADISTLARLVFLSNIDVSKNKISSVIAFANMRYLEVLNCSYNNILTLEPLVNSESIVEIHANDNNIIDVSYVDAFASLNYLDVENNNLIS